HTPRINLTFRHIGAGSGAVSLILSDYDFSKKYTLTDICNEAMTLIQKNILCNNLGHKMQAIHSDLFQSLEKSIMMPSFLMHHYGTKMHP
ncbi:MAG: polypeptide subunit release factor methylase, partial [Alphaproteobacteria bacterium]